MDEKNGKKRTSDASCPVLTRQDRLYPDKKMGRLESLTFDIMKMHKKCQNKSSAHV